MRKKIDTIYLFFAINYLAQGMGGLVYEPISYLLKDRLKLSAGESAMFVFWMTLPFLIKPLFGILTDLFPIAGYRRKPHIMVVSAASAVSWFALAAQRHYSYLTLLVFLVTVNVGVVCSDVICDAVMVEQGRESHKTGLYQAVQIGTLYASLVVSGLGGGWLAAHASYRGIFALAALFPLMIFASAFWARERPAEMPQARALRGFTAFLGARRFWLLSLVIFLWSFSPFLGTAQFYYQSESLKLSPVFIGLLATLSGIAGVLGAAFYGRVVVRRWSTGQLVYAAVVVGGPLSLLYLLYLGPLSAALVTAVLGFAGVAFRLALMDLAAQSCPPYAEATAFAAYMAVFNLAASASNTVGGKLYDLLRGVLGAYPALVLLSLLGSLCTMSCWFFLPFLMERGTAAHPRRWPERCETN